MEGETGAREVGTGPGRGPEISSRWLTLGRGALLATLAIAAIVSVTTAVALERSRAAILESSERLRLAGARRVEEKVGAELGRATRALADLERGILTGAISVDDPAALEASLFTQVLAEPHLEEVTLTRANLLGYDDEGEARLASDGRWQLSVSRDARDGVTTRITRQAGGAFAASSRARAAGGDFLSVALVPSGSGVDPTAHPTFSVLAAKARRGRAVWSDLHFSELDQALPAQERRVVLSVQRAIEDRAGRFLGVARVGLLTRELDAIARTRVDDADAEDPHQVALLAVSSGEPRAVRLVARVDPRDRVEETDDELRVVSDHPSPALAALFASPLVAALDPDHPDGGGALTVGGERWLATLRALPSGGGGTSGWCVAVLVPELHYTRVLVRFERLFLGASAATLALVLLVGALALAAVRRGLAKVVATTSRMRRFDFERSDESSALRELDEVGQGLERAKTAVRAMGRYVPMDLVRRLYASNEEPALGGELVEVTLLFTDIEGFTTLSERLPPDELARRLGDYLEAMTVAIQGTGGTIDKYIGDAVMAFWNAPQRVDRHATRACEAALACMAATRALYASPSWAGLPPLVTRFGIHRAKVMVGNFGARTRLSYTALGDGVNLASRLEPLCKQYGVVALVSEDVVAEAGEGLLFRRVDRVAVKGKSRGIDVHELLGRAGEAPPNLARARLYEEAFAAHLRREFARAIDLLAPQVGDDPPSAVLLTRCRELLRAPPPEGWDGVHHASSK